MPRTGEPVPAPALAAAEWRVHQHDRRRQLLGQQVVDEFGIVAGDVLAQQLAQQGRSIGIALVERQRGAGSRRMDREHAGTGGGFEDMIVMLDPSGPGGEPREGDGRAELLQLDLMLAAIALGREPAFELKKRCESVIARQA